MRSPLGAPALALAAVLAAASPAAAQTPAVAAAQAPAAAAAQSVYPDPQPARYERSPEGHDYRVVFDPASRIWIGGAGTVARGTTSVAVGGFEVDAGLGYRTRSATGEGRDRVSWEVDHRIVAGWVRPVPRPEGVPPLDASLYGVTMLRHDASPSLVLPTSPPVGIPFPFDVGMDAEVGRVTTLSYSGIHALRLGVVRGALLLDPWRSGLPGRSFSIGIGARYDIEVVPGMASTAVVHRVAPMTAGALRFRYQTGDGLSVVDWRGDVVPHYATDGGWRLLALSSLHLERTLVAFNDQPLAAVLDGGYRFDPPRKDAQAVNDFRVSLGLTMNLMLR